MTCTWCGTEATLIKHHYPVPKKDGGTATVDICPNCHQFAHQGLLIDATKTEDESSYQGIIESTTLKAIRERFPLLWTSFDFYDPFLKKVIINPYWKFKKATQ